MARSDYIYVAMRLAGEYSTLAAAFTVKHELMTWLERQEGRFEVWRVGDGYNRSKPITRVVISGPVEHAEAINPAPTDEDQGESAESISAPPCSGGVLPTPKDINTSLIGGPSCNTRFDKIPDGHAELDDWPRILGMNGMVWE